MPITKISKTETLRSIQASIRIPKNVFACSPLAAIYSLTNSPITLGVIVGAGVAEGRIKLPSSPSATGAGVDVDGSGVKVTVALGETVGNGARVGSDELQAIKPMLSSPVTTKISKSWRNLEDWILKVSSNLQTFNRKQRQPHIIECFEHPEQSGLIHECA